MNAIQFLAILNNYCNFYPSLSIMFFSGFSLSKEAPCQFSLIYWYNSIQKYSLGCLRLIFSQSRPWWLSKKVKFWKGQALKIRIPITISLRYSAARSTFLQISYVSKTDWYHTYQIFKCPYVTYQMRYETQNYLAQ